MSKKLHLVARTSNVKPEKGLLILLHGLGSNEEDLFGLAEAVNPSLSVCSLRAPFEYGGFGYKWFSLDLSQNGVAYNLDEARLSQQLVELAVRELQSEHGVGREQTILAGFSQGAMLSLAFLLQHSYLVGHGWLMSGALGPEIDSLIQTSPQPFSVLVQHGLSDPVLPVAYGREVRAFLTSLPHVDVTYREYPMAHGISDASLRDGVEWIDQQLG